MNLLSFMRRTLKGGPQADLPAFGSAGIPTGHLFQHTVIPKLFTNIGSECYAMHVCEGVNRLVLVERFLQVPGLHADRDAAAANTYATATCQLNLDKNPNFEILGTNHSDDDVTFADGGGITMETDGAAADQIILLPHLNTGATAWTAAKWNTDDEISFETVIKTGATVATMKIHAGFKLTNVQDRTTNDDQVLFAFTTASDTRWQCVGSNTGVDDVRDSGVKVEAATSYHLLLVVDGKRVPRFYINGARVATGAALKANTDLIPYIGVHDLGGAAKKITVRGLACGKSYND